MKLGKGHNIRTGSRRMIFSVAGMTVVWLIGVALAAGGIKAFARSSTAPVSHPNEKTGRGLPASIFGSHAFGLGGGQAAAQGRPLLAEEAFKNIQVLKGIPVDDFMGTMGIMADSLGFCCSECHEGAGTDKVNWAADNSRKRTARKMVTMVATINRDNFGGRQVVTCWTCHRNRDRPLVTPTFHI